MRTPKLLCVLAVAACGDVGGGQPDVPDATPLDATPADAAPEVPWISEALDCGTPASAGGLGNGTDLTRVDVDLAAFPDALCNDGTGAVFFVRPASSPAAANRWVIQLQGGGECTTPDSCAKRWCSVDTNFGETQMTSDLAPPDGTRADGILNAIGALGEPNPVGDWNHVFIHYCSSDQWSGAAGTIELDAAHPVTGAPEHFRIAFDGAQILDAVIATLRKDGAAVASLPDLDDADAVLFAGASAGGAGVIENADRLGTTLRASNPDLAYDALVDSRFPPDFTSLDLSTGTPCAELGACDYASLAASVLTPAVEMWGARGEDTCATWHAAHAPDSAWECDDPGHVIRDHVTTPMLVRQGLTDSLLGPQYVDDGFSVPGQGPLTITLFAQLVDDQLAALPARASEEPRAVAPAVYGPRCDKHETLGDDASVFGVHVTVGGATPTMFDVFRNLVTGGTPTIAVYAPGDPVDCQ
jgi:hypothetical protein